MNAMKVLRSAILVTGAMLSLLVSIFSGGLRAGASLQGGTSVFEQKCATCHGKDGKGLPQWRSKGQPDFTDDHFQHSITDQEISDVIHNGKGKYMPSFKDKLSGEQITALVKQVRAFGKK